MCKHELNKLNARLKIVMGDIAVMTMILEMTDCDKKLIQMEHMSLMHCIDECTKKSFIEFNHDGLQKKINKLQSSLSQELMQDTFKDLFTGIEDERDELLEHIDMLKRFCEETKTTLE